MTRDSSFKDMPGGFDNASFSSSVPDLAAWRLPNDRWRNWNNKISSVQLNWGSQASWVALRALVSCLKLRKSKTQTTF
jgi:hypothetical protein